MNDYSVEAEKICNSVEDIARGNLFNKEDLRRITEIALQNNRMELLEKIAFSAKFTQGLVSVIQKQDNKIDEEYFAKVKEELINSFEKVKSLLEELLSLGSDFLSAIFKEKYLELSQQSLFNLNNLCSDLGYLKLYLNDLKRNS
jgi:hypothetical protein